MQRRFRLLHLTSAIPCSSVCWWRLAGFVVGLVFALVVMHVAPHLHESAEQMQTDPLLVIPVEAVIYAIVAAASFLIFPLFWNRPFGQGVHWRAFVARRRWWVLVGNWRGHQRHRAGAFELPAYPERAADRQILHPSARRLADRRLRCHRRASLRRAGFPRLSATFAGQRVGLGDAARTHAAGAAGRAAGVQPAEGEWQQQTAVYSSLPHDGASVSSRGKATDSDAEPGSEDGEAGSGDTDPRWSLPALIFSTIITSIGFAMLHGAQLAHSFAPLAVLFAVSVVLCITRLRFHSLAASTVVHSMYNATIFVMLFIGTDGFRHLDKLGK